MIYNYNNYINNNILSENLLSRLSGPSEDIVIKYLHDEYDIDIDKIPETPEDFLLHMFNDIKVFEYDKNIYVGNSIYWEKNGKLLIKKQPDTLIFFVSYPYIWKLLESIYGLNRIECEKLLTKFVQEKLGWKDYHMINAIHKWFFPDELESKRRI